MVARRTWASFASAVTVTCVLAMPAVSRAETYEFVCKAPAWFGSKAACPTKNGAKSLMVKPKESLSVSIGGDESNFCVDVIIKREKGTVTVKSQEVCPGGTADNLYTNHSEKEVEIFIELDWSGSKVLGGNVMGAVSVK